MFSTQKIHDVYTPGEGKMFDDYDDAVTAQDAAVDALNTRLEPPDVAPTQAADASQADPVQGIVDAIDEVVNGPPDVAPTQAADSPPSGGFFNEDLTEPTPGRKKKEMTVPTEEEFFSNYAAHKDIRGQVEGNSDVVMQSIMRHGFQDDSANALPPYRGGKSGNVIDQHYGPKAGDVYYIAPPGAWKDSPNGMRIRAGWKPQPHEIVRITEDHQSLYEAYIAGLPHD